MHMHTHREKIILSNKIMKLIFISTFQNSMHTEVFNHINVLFLVQSLQFFFGIKSSV